MADTLATVGVKVNYDSSGTDQATAGFEQLGQAAQQTTTQVTNLNTTMSQSSKMNASVAAQLQAAGVQWNTITKSFTSIAPAATQAATATAQATTNITQHNAAVQAGVGALNNMSGALNKAILDFVAWAGGIAAAYMSVREAAQLFQESIAAASGIQQATFHLEQLTGSAEVATEKIDELRKMSTESGAFSFQQLSDAERRIYLITNGTEQLTEHVRDLSAMAIKSGESVDSMVTAYQRLVTSIENRTPLMTRGIGGATVIMNALRQETGLTDTAIRQAFKDGQISIELANKALHDYGNYTQTVAEYNKTWEGQIGLLENRWQEFLAILGAPVIDVLTPMISGFSDYLKAHQGMLEGWVQRETIMIKNGQYGEAIGTALADGLINSFKAVGPVLLGFFQGLMDQMAQLAIKSDWWSDMIGRFIGETPAKPLPPGQLPGGVNIPPESNLGPSYFAGEYDLSKPRLRTTDRPVIPKPPTGGGGGESDWEKYKSDLTIINHYWEQYDIIQSKVGDETEKNRRVLELTEKTMKELYDPAQFDPYMGKLGQLMQMEAEREREIKDLSYLAKIGAASFADSWRLGLDKALEAMGTWQTRMAAGIQAIGDALTNDIAGGLTDILDGTKTAAQGFRDMALSIVKDIESIIVKQLVEYYIELALQALRGGPSTGAGSPMEVTGTASGFAPGYQSGGYVPGGGVVHAGEYVFSTQAVQAMGLGWLDRAHAAAKQGQPVDMTPLGSKSASHSVSNQVNVTIHNHGDGGTSTRSEGGTSDADAREFARAVEAIATKTFTKQQRWRGGLYKPRNM
jgi:hypothetical protein